MTISGTFLQSMREYVNESTSRLELQIANDEWLKSNESLRDMLLASLDVMEGIDAIHERGAIYESLKSYAEKFMQARVANSTTESNESSVVRLEMADPGRILLELFVVLQFSTAAFLSDQARELLKVLLWMGGQGEWPELDDLRDLKELPRRLRVRHIPRSALDWEELARDLMLRQLAKNNESQRAEEHDILTLSRPAPFFCRKSGGWLPSIEIGIYWTQRKDEDSEFLDCIGTVEKELQERAPIGNFVRVVPLQLKSVEIGGKVCGADQVPESAIRRAVERHLAPLYRIGTKSPSSTSRRWLEAMREFGWDAQPNTCQIVTWAKQVLHFHFADGLPLFAGDSGKTISISILKPSHDSSDLHIDLQVDYLIAARLRQELNHD